MKRVTQKRAKQLCTEIIEQNTKFKNAYFFTPPQHAHQRRSYESRQSISHCFYYFKDRKKIAIDLDFDVSCSCKNVYINRNYSINGIKCNIAKIKNLAKQL